LFGTMNTLVRVNGEVPRLSAEELTLISEEMHGFYTAPIEVWEVTFNGVVPPGSSALSFDDVTTRFEDNPVANEYTREVLCRDYGVVMMEHSKNLFRDIGDVDRFKSKVSIGHASADPFLQLLRLRWHACSLKIS
jgi:hypothetical protein